jgi:signal peptidase I
MENVSRREGNTVRTGKKKVYQRSQPLGTVIEKPAKPQVNAALKSALKDILDLLIKIAVIALTAFALSTFLFGVVRYQEPSMDPSIKDGDLILFYRYTKNGYLPRDAVVLDFEGKRQVRRVIAIAGDTVDITEEGLLINEAPQQEIGITQPTERYQDGVELPLTVPEGHVFVLGDARTGAADSRIYGCVKISDTYGKVIAVIRRRSI